MIELTRLNGSPLVVNSDLIQCAESSPDTTLTLIHGEKIVVSESLSQVIDLAVAFRARLMAQAAIQAPGGLILNSGETLQTLGSRQAAAQAALAVAEIDPDIDPAARRRRT